MIKEGTILIEQLMIVNKVAGAQCESFLCLVSEPILFLGVVLEHRPKARTDCLSQ